ncbi:Mitochondrial 2-oxodicarboxylate carrier [Nymphon striatum]|nr:Mitochondrial 2-oxodicarboxylate carrier [Nymphon striatum]
MQVCAGGSAGLVEVSIMHPLDLIKTRFQIQRPDDPNSYKSIGDCFKKIYRSEGLLGFYKGILPPILAETPKRAVKTFTLAGLFSGLTEAFVINPFEVVKVKLQADRQSVKAQLSTFSMAREIVRSGGLGMNGLNKGLTATLGRHGDERMEFLRRFGIGLLAGIVASCINIPFDVAKSRIQGPQPIKGQIKYKHCFATIKLVFKEEG